MTDRPGDAAELERLQQHLMTNANDRVSWHNLGVEWRRFGNAEAALNAFDESLKRGIPAPETLSMRGHVLADLNRFDEAVAQYRAALRAHPALIDAHDTLSRLLPELGRGGEALDSYRIALRAAPETGMLWVSAMGAAKSLSSHEQLLDWARAAEARFGGDTMITAFAANALSALGRVGEAMDEAVKGVTTEPDYAPAQTVLAHIALKAGDLARAEAAALASVKLDPFDQSPWALLTAIWRLMNDPREAWVADYERLVMPVMLEGVNLAATRDALTALHVTRAHPADQSLRGGTQTRGNLFDRRDPVIFALRRSIERAMAGALTGMEPDDHHPFYGRLTGRMRFQGSWSVRLASEGLHISHIHPQGWLSSACYIDLPPEVGGNTDAGALAFG